MEQSLRLLLTEGSKLNEQTLLNVYNKLNAPGSNFASDLYILTAEKFFDLTPPIQKHIIDKAENMITIYNRLQEPTNQFQIRGLICQSLINSHRVKQQRGIPATELNLKSIDFMLRALKLIQSNSLYQPIALRAVFLFYQIAFPFFITEQRHHLSQITPIALSLLETHLSGKFDANLRLYIAISLLYCCIMDDFNKLDDASKQMAKLFSLVPTDLIQLRYSLLHYYTHFSRKSSGGLIKQKLELNEQLQKAVIMYQAARSNNTTNTKDLAEVLKICLGFLENKKETNDETCEAEILIGETGRLAAQFGQTQLAEECQAKSSTARSQIARFHSTLITAELSLKAELKPEERAEIINNCNHVMSLSMFQGDLLTVQDSAALLWSHCIQILNYPQLIKRYLLSACDILNKVNSQANVMRSQMHFAIAKIFQAEHDNMKAIDHLKRALALDYLWVDHPSKLIHPFDRFLVPFFRMLSVEVDSYGQQNSGPDEAYSFIAIRKKINQNSLQESFKILSAVPMTDISAYDAIDATHYASVFIEIIKNASEFGCHQIAVDGCHLFLSVEFETVQFDTAVELQCQATVYGITSCFKISPENIQYAIEFVNFSIERSKILKKNRLSFNSISAIWNSFFSRQNPENCGDYVDFLVDCINHLFESDFPNSKLLIGQIVNFYVKVVLSLSNEPHQNSSPVKKKGSSLDATKQKQLKTAEDTIIKSFQVVTSIYEKKALVDRLVEIFGKRNQLPPNQSDPELSILVTLATIMNEKVQHKPETLTAAFSQILTMKQPALFALFAEKSCKLDLHQITIDSATKAIELMPNPSNKDEKYHIALARFYRGLAFLKLIQPDLQEFSCQDKLRSDSAADFLRAAALFTEAKSTENAKTAISYFISTIAVGENFKKFRELLSDLLVEAISLVNSKKIIINDDLGVRLYRIYLLALIDQKDFVTCRKTIKNAINILNKSVHGDIWDLNLVVTFNADCEKTQQPLIDEMLRVKQLGDSAYQSKLWTFVADLATDANIQRTALNKAIDVLKSDDIELKFKSNMNYARWLYNNNASWDEIETAIARAEKAIVNDESQPPERGLEHRFEVAAFRLSSTPDFEVFDQAKDDVDNLSNSLWELTVHLNNAVDEDEASSSMSKRPSSRNKGSSHKLQQTPKTEDFNNNPSTINDWIQIIQQIENHKTIQPSEPYKFVNDLLTIIDVLENVGLEYFLLKLWYHVLLISKLSIQWPRFDQYLYMKLKLFLDKLNVVSPFVYSTDFILTEDEKREWTQKVGRYQTDPPSKFPPLRKLLNKQAEILVILGEYRSALYLINSALNQAEQLDDKVTSSESIQLIAAIKVRSGDSQGAIDMLAKSNQNIKMPIEFWVNWYSTAFSVQNNSSDFVENLVIAFQQNCTSGKILSIKETIDVYKLYRNAALCLSPEGAYNLYENVLKGNLVNLETFLPSIDTTIVYYWRSCLSPKFPKNLANYKSFGYEVIDVINACSDLYNNILDDKGDDASLPLLCRFVDIVNLFGYLVLKFAPTIRSIEQNGLDMNLIGSHESLLAEFIDKSQEPLADLSPTAAILHFDNVKNNDFIPNKYAVKMNVYLGQCLHAISTENVTLQSSVRYLWKGISLLTDLKEYSLTGEIAQELFSILRSSDISGAVYQFLIAQSVKAYTMRINMLMTEYAPSNRERLFVTENQRLRDLFLNPEISQMFVSSQKYFETIPNGTTLVRLGRKMEEIRAWVTNNKNCLLLIIDQIGTENDKIYASVITLGTPDKFDSVPLSADFEEVSMKFDIFKQIISTTKVETPSNDQTANKGTPLPNSRGKGAKAKRTMSKVAAAVPKSELKDSNFAKEALKLNNPEFQKFIEDLCASFEPLKEILPEEHSDTVLILSSNKFVHSIPFDCISAFDSFTTIYRDFSIMAALNRKNPCTEPPSFGPSS